MLVRRHDGRVDALAWSKRASLKVGGARLSVKNTRDL
jgi:hypothetical protein